MCSQPHISQEVVRQWEISQISYLGGRYNHHWLVERRGHRLVLRAYSAEPFDDIPYELEVLRRLAESEWPVPSAVDEPIAVDGRTWTLFTWLPGVPPTETGPDERRARGRLLAQLHESATPLARMGQREGFGRSHEVVADPEMLHLVEAYEHFSPAEGHIMRWHLEADFANAWRGYQDEVIDGYQEVRRLTDLERQLLIPAYWSWMFLGVKREIEAIVAGTTQPHGFEWQIRHILRREGRYGRAAEPYPGPK